MERAVKGLVTGRSQWVAFTSANAVKAVRDKFEDYGLDARAFAGIKTLCREQTALALRAFGVVPDLVPASRRVGGWLLAEFPAFDLVFDPIERVFLAARRHPRPRRSRRTWSSSAGRSTT